jgi:hypothetical protein
VYVSVGSGRGIHPVIGFGSAKPPEKTLKMGTGPVYETPENLHILMWPSAREHFFDFCRRENFKACNFLASCCCFPVLLHVVDNFIVPSYLLVNWFYFQLLQNFFIPSVVKKRVSRRSEKFNPNLCQ